MALYVVDQAEEHHLDLILAVNYKLKLFTNDVISGLTAAQIDALTESSFTEATFAGYADKTLTGGSWTTTQGNPSTGTYAQQTFTRSTTGVAQTVRGYYVVRSSDNKLQWFEYLTGPLSIASSGDAVVITPTFTYDDDQEATVTARGIVARQTLTTSSVAYSADASSDFTLATVPVDNTRTYQIHLNSVCGLAGTGRWIVELWIDGVLSFRVEDREGTNLAFVTNFVAEWEPATTGNSVLLVKVNEISGTASIDFPADPTFPRRLWVEDIGARLP